MILYEEKDWRLVRDEAIFDGVFVVHTGCPFNYYPIQKYGGTGTFVLSPLKCFSCSQEYPSKLKTMFALFR